MTYIAVDGLFRRPRITSDDIDEAREVDINNWIAAKLDWLEAT
jgi:hypothetical protein